MSKNVYASAGLTTPAYRVVRRSRAYDVADLTAALGPHTVVKPANEGSSVGMTIVADASGLGDAIESAFGHDPLVLVERFEAGVEVTVGVVGNDDPVALPTLEIVPANDFYDYESKYVPGMSRHIIPAGVSEPARAECQRLAVEAHLALGCAGMSRSDNIVTPDGTVYLLETNTIPGMTKTSLLPDAAAAAGIPFPELCERLVRLGVERWSARRG
jgi:D-alanine-D-alanine ligase